MLKRYLKAIFNFFAANFGAHTKTSSHPRLLILMYHRVLPLDCPAARNEEPGMVVSPDTFRNHMRLISSLFEVTTLSEWYKKKDNNEKLPDKSCVITFDDGWLDNFQYAFPILKEFEQRASIFVVSEMVNSNKRFWPERLINIIRQLVFKNNLWDSDKTIWLLNIEPNLRNMQTPPNTEELSTIIKQAKRFSDEKLHLMINKIEVLLNQVEEATPSILNWSQIREMVDSGIIEIGSHTCTHTRLNNEISTSVLEKEIVSSKISLESKIGCNIENFCYPNGDITNEADRLVRATYKTAVTTKNGWNDNHTDRFMLKRISIHEGNSKTSNQFLARISGWI